MLFLPPAPGGERNVRLPLTDAATAALATAWLSDDAAARRGELEALLAAEPSLIVWCVLRGGATLDASAGLSSVAYWLDTVGSGAFRGGEDGCEETVDSQPATWAELAERFRRLSERAITSAPPDIASQVRLCAALYFAEPWVQTSPAALPNTEFPGGEPADWWPACRSLLRGEPSQDPNRLPAHLAAAARCVAEAAQQLPAATDDTAETHQLRRRWLSSTIEPLHWFFALSEKLRRLRRLETRFAAALEEEKLAALKEFAYGISHELNNPLTNIASRAQTLLRDESDVERRRKLATINSQAFRAYEMIADLMLFARPPQIEPRPVNLSKLLEQVLQELKESAAAQQTELAHLTADRELNVTADPTYLAAAIKALCINSLEALAAGGRIEVAASRTDWRPDDIATGSWLALTFRDNGPGIPPEVRRHIFDPYYSGREAGRGLGLGLSKCWRVVSLHGGRIEVQSDALGTLFTIYLPLQRGPRPAPLLTAPSPAARDSSEFGRLQDAVSPPRAN